MEFMTQKEYKLRELLQDGRIERTAKNGNS